MSIIIGVDEVSVTRIRAASVHNVICVHGPFVFRLPVTPGTRPRPATIRALAAVVSDDCNYRVIVRVTIK